MGAVLFVGYIVVGVLMGIWYYKTTAQFYSLESIQDKALADSSLVGVFWPFYLAWYWIMLAFRAFRRG